ncbi:MAG TPA: DUF4349 domain-containing protein [Caulobacteraceae bacterium]|nr:DUF4349 domain-containing protein [Caulobacteraceae bacterium]
MNRTLPTAAAAVAIAALSLAACKKSELMAPPPKPPPASSRDANAAMAKSSPQDAATATSPTDQVAEAPPSPQAPMLAMAYRLGLAVPAAQVRPLMESHQEACERAGTDQCQVMAASADAEHGDRATASLTLRATPAWVRLFRDRAEADAKDLGGKIEVSGAEGDDLSTQIADTDAAQQARAAERARLTELMRRHTRSLEDTLQVEQEITRVQGEMDQASSELAAWQNRIVMQTVTISYESTAMAAPEGDAAPLASAARSFLGNVFEVLAGLLTLASFLLPFALVGAPIAWLVARRRKPAPETPAPAE